MFGVLVFVSLASNSYANFSGNVADTVGPDEFVEAGVNSDILGVHFGGGETFDVTDATGGSLLELDSVEELVHVNSVVAAGGLHFSLDHLLLLLRLK